jgi:hypothetical protein
MIDTPLLRVVPWITDPSFIFLDNYIYYTKLRKNQFKVFEFGMGNSTLYFLARKCIIDSVDHDEKWVDMITKMSDLTYPNNPDFNPKLSTRPYNNVYENRDYDLVVIDGRDRVACLKTVLEKGLRDDAVLLLDNTERVPGPGKYSEYKQLLCDYNCIHFEQPFVKGSNPQSGGQQDICGNRVGHRWVTTIAFKNSFRYSTLGIPML